MEGAGAQPCPTPQPEAGEPSPASAPTRADQEISAQKRRELTEPFVAYSGAVGSTTAKEKLFKEASDSLVDYSRRLIEARDYGLPFEDEEEETIGDIHGQIRKAGLIVFKFVLRMFCIETPRTLKDMFSPDGEDAAGIESKKEMRTFRAVRSALADQLIRSRTLYHNGCTQSQMKLPPQLIKDGDVRVDAKTRLERAAQTYKPPTDAEIAKSLPTRTTSNTHPRLASSRYHHVTKLRQLADGLKYEQYDPCISANPRDNKAYGDRPLHQLKDLANAPVPRSEGMQFGFFGPFNHGTETFKRVVTLIDCLSYSESLREYSGEDMIVWTCYYPDLAGKTDESVYYADSQSTFTEIIGLDAVVGTWKNQIAWDFTCNDVVYIENLDGSAFTVYKVYRYPHPELLKQTVFLCAIQTVNMPYAVANLLTLWTKDHTLESSGIGTPKPAENVKLVPRDPSRPFTQDILVMTAGTPTHPTVSVKYKNSPGPDSSATMSMDTYHWIKYQHSCNGRGLTTHEAVKRLELYAEKDRPANVPGSAAYCELLRTVAWWGDLPCVIYYDARTKDSVPTETPVEAETAKAVMAAPKITSNMPCVLAKTPEAMEAYKREKMVGLVNDTVPTAEWTKISELCVKHYIEGTAKESGVKRGSLQLIDRAKVSDSRTRPAQIARKEANGIGPAPPELGRVENKIEAAHKTAACPRGVQNPDFDISELSGVLAKSFEPVISSLAHYHPGLQPLPIAESMRETYHMSMEHQASYEGGGLRSVDYTAADEKHCKLSNKILRGMIEYYFTEDDVADALWLYDQCFHMRLKVGASTMSSGWKNASGTGITTILNTIVFAAREMQTVIVALIFRAMEDAGELKVHEYVQDESGGNRPYPNLTFSRFVRHLRSIDKDWELHKIAGGNQPKVPVLQTVYSWIGPKFGDDGVDPSTPFVSDRVYECAMKYVDKQDGFIRKLETSDAVNGEPVEYLSRIYPYLHGSLSSFCKVEKALDKLSVATNRDRDRYILKLKGYWQNDRNTPIVGAFLQAVSKMYQAPLVKLTEAELSALAEQDKELFWKLANGSFPSDEGASDLAYECVASDYGMTSGELAEFDDKLRKLSTWREIQAMMVPAKMLKESAKDPLGLAETLDPPGTERVAAFDCTTRGKDPRMEDFESPAVTPEPPVATASADAKRSEAALAALGLE